MLLYAYIACRVRIHFNSVFTGMAGIACLHIEHYKVVLNTINTSVYGYCCQIIRLQSNMLRRRFDRLQAISLHSNILQLLIKLYICSSVHRNSRLDKSNKMQQYADIYLLLNYSTCFGRPSRPSSGVHKTVVVASGTDPYLVTFEEACFPDSMICTRGCNYSFVYS